MAIILAAIFALEIWDRSPFSESALQSKVMHQAQRENREERYMSILGLHYGRSRGHGRTTLVLVFTALLSLFLGSSAQAQILYGTLTGNVTDPLGASISNARIEALDVATGVSRVETADVSGVYRFTALQPGTYTITASATSFGTDIVNQVEVLANSVRRLDFHMTVARQTEKIVVEAQAQTLQTDTADVHTDLSSTEIESLPLMGSEGRNFQALYKIIPGFGLPTEQNSSAANPQRSMGMNVNGQSLQGNNTRIDGAQNSYPYLPQSIAYVPPADAVETVNIATNSFDAEQGMAGGAAINVLIKSGTNEYHGTGTEYYNANNFNAKGYFTPKTVNIGGQSVPNQLQKNIKHQFGGTIGGPIKQNKLFFFGDVERSTQRARAQATPTLPPAAMRTGDFRSVATKIYDPNTGNFDGTGRQQISCNGVLNVICPERIDPAAKTIFSMVPLPNLNTVTANYLAVANTTFDRNDGDVKVNWVPNDQSTAFARYSFSKSAIVEPGALGKADGNAINGGQLGTSSGLVQNVGLGATYTVNPNVLLDWNLGFTRQRLGALPDDLSSNIGLDTLHIPGTNGTDNLYGGFPIFVFSTQWSSYGNTGVANPFLFRDQQYVTNANASWLKGKHSLRGGIEYNRSAINHFQAQGGSFQSARGSLRFGGNQTALKGGPSADAYNMMASFLLGLPSETGKATQLNNPIAIRMQQWAWYARDQYEASKKLTVNYGVRWEYYPMAHSDNGRGIRYLDLKTMNVLIGGVNNIPLDDGVDVGSGQFLARAGATYRLTGKTVVRGGYGMSADPSNFRWARNWYPAVDVTDFVSTQYNPITVMSTDNHNTFAPYPGLGFGIPVSAPTDISTGKVPLPANKSTGTMANPFHRGTNNSFNFAVESEFKGFMASAGYVGSRMVHPLVQLDVNAAPINGGTPGRLLNAKWNNTWSSINSIVPFKSNSYDSLQTRLTRQFGHGSQVGVVYTFSKSIDYADNEDAGGVGYAYPDYQQKSKALTGWDRPHSFQFYGAYQLPFGKDHRWATSGIANKVGGGWQLNWVLSDMSGTPFTVSGDGTLLNAPGNSQTADLVAPVHIHNGHATGDSVCATSDLSCHYFDPTSFAQPKGVAFGTSSRNFLRGPGYFNLDSSVYRNFAITEHVKFQFRAEGSSLTNTPQFANPNSSVTGSNFGVITSANGGSRRVSFAGRVSF